MTNLSAALNPEESRSSKKNFYLTEILMLKSIIALLVLTFFLLSEMQASTKEVKQLKRDHVNQEVNTQNSDLVNSK